MLQKEIIFKNIIVRGNPREGKTLITNMMVDPYYRIYSNVDYFYDYYGRKIQTNIRINSIQDIKRKIHYSEIPGIVVIDEGGINLNSRRSQSQENMDFGELLFLGGKLNCYFVWVSQRFKSIDINQRDLADLIIHMRKISRGKKHPLFIATREKVGRGGKLEYDNEWKIDIISWMKYYNKSYDTLETSKLTS